MKHGEKMRHEIDTILHLLPGGNKYRVVDKQPTKDSELKGCYQIECIDFWRPEDLGDGIMCWKECDKIWIASFHADFMPVWQTAEDFKEVGLS